MQRGTRDMWSVKYHISPIPAIEMNVCTCRHTCTSSYAHVPQNVVRCIVCLCTCLHIFRWFVMMRALHACDGLPEPVTEKPLCTHMPMHLSHDICLLCAVCVVPMHFRCTCTPSLRPSENHIRIGNRAWRILFDEVMCEYVQVMASIFVPRK